MEFIISDSATVVCTTKPAHAYMTDPLKFHLHLKNVEEGTEEYFNNPTVVPGTTPTPGNAGTSGIITFNNVSFALPGLYLIRVLYASQVDLDSNPVSLILVKQDTVKKIVPVTSINI